MTKARAADPTPGHRSEAAAHDPQWGQAASASIVNVAQSRWAEALHGSPQLVAQSQQIKNLFGGSAPALKGPAPMQRMIAGLSEGSKGLEVKADNDRPPGIIKDQEGDHMTPFVTLQHEIINAIAGADLKGAWANLQETFKVYQSLPGWSESKTSVQQGTSSYGRYIYDVPNLLATGGDLDALLVAANAMLALRNQIGLSAMKGKKAKGVGHAEAEWAGGLQSLEQKARAGTVDPYSKRDDILVNMGILFDHGRNEGRDSDDLAEKTWEQHCRTIVSAYPELATQAKIDWQDVDKCRKASSKKWHALYG